MRKITVLYINTDSTLGGSSRSLVDLIESVSDHVSPIILLPKKGAALECFQNHGYRCIVCPFPILYDFPKTDWKRCIFHPWRLRCVKYLRAKWRCVRYVKKLLDKEHVDIVHTNTTPTDVGVCLSKGLQARHVWHVREALSFHFTGEIYRGVPYVRSLINKADARVSISSALVRHWNLIPQNTFILNNAIGLKNEVCCNFAKEKFFLFVSYRLTEAKGARFAIRAFGNSGIYKNGYRLKMVGNCNDMYRESLLETASECGCADFVDFIPCQENLKPFYLNATAFVMASVFEGLGRVTAEAMLYGCPVIARAVGGTLDLIMDGETGYLFNTEAECEKLLYKVSSSSQERIILNAQNFVNEHLSREAYGPKIMEVYQKVLK